MKRTLLSISILLIILGLGAGIAYVLLDQGYVALNHPSRKAFPVRGIDVSHHQGEIRWQELDPGQVHFVYMKATEGGDFVDPRFASNWEAARRQGLARGAYHFYTFCKPGRVQAANFLANVPDEQDLLPPAIDLEFGGNCSKRPPRSELLFELRQFIRLLEKAYRKQPILYVTGPFLEKYLKQDLPDYKLWIRNVYNRPNPPRDWIIWQYNARGFLPGIDGFVDLNVFKGNQKDFESFQDSMLPDSD